MHIVLDWSTLFPQCWNSLKPGGWSETNHHWSPNRSDNPDVSLTASTFLIFIAVFESWREPDIGPRANLRHQDRLHLQGYTNVETIHVK